MDPGNWMTDIAAGAAFNYSLLFVVFSSSIMAMFLQGLALRLGMVTRKDIAQHCRDHYSPWVVRFLWVTAEIAIIACDLAEVIGSAVAIKLLFNVPLVWGVIITSLDVLVLLVLSGRSMRWIEGIVLALMSTIIVCFAVELWCVLLSTEFFTPQIWNPRWGKLRKDSAHATL
jgi:manganese transport protein